MQSFIGAIRLFGGTFAPHHYALASGTIITIQSNTALFSLYGSRYGGDGRSTFALPDLRGRVPVHRNNGWPGGAQLNMQGQIAGTEKVTLTEAQMPLHSHSWQATNNAGTTNDPQDKVLARQELYSTQTQDLEDPAVLYADSVHVVGSGLAHNNMMPFLGINFIVALQGIFPPRN